MPQIDRVTDENSLTGRVRRYARAGSAMAGLGARLAGEAMSGCGSTASATPPI